MSVPALASRPSVANVQRGHCPHVHQDLWDHQEILCRGTCPSMRGGRGRARTRCWTRRRGRWFVSQVRVKPSNTGCELCSFLLSVWLWASEYSCSCSVSKVVLGSFKFILKVVVIFFIDFASTLNASMSFHLSVKSERRPKKEYESTASLFPNARTKDKSKAEEVLHPDPLWFTHDFLHTAKS